MDTSARLTNKQAYETKDESGRIYGAIGPRDWDRFRQTLAYIPEDTKSLLDAGCDRGHWLNYATARRQLELHLGVDISEGRIAEAQRHYPHLHFQAGILEQLNIPAGSFEVVTCLEVLEHIPEWEAVLQKLLSIAARRVVVTVPYREKRLETICVHCGRLTPLYGHLRSYDEASFPSVPGWRLSLHFIKDYGICLGLRTRLYRAIRPRRGWLVAQYDPTASRGN